MSGPLDGCVVVEVAGIGPGPFAAMMLADMGAEVVRVDRPDAVAGPPHPVADAVLRRGRRSVALDLKHPDGHDVLLTMVARADVLLEGFRPGVMERLGLGPDECLAVNPRLVYGRMTGWGQGGPYAGLVGHDINYIALAGALAHLAPPGDRPRPPLNLVGDFGGGGMLLAFGVVCALLESRRSGTGQVVDAAVVDGAASLMSMFWSDVPSGTGPSGMQVLSSEAHFYDVYACADGTWISVGAIEPQFYAALLRVLGLEHDEAFAQQMDPASWPALGERLAEIFATRTRAEWVELFEGTDACVAPVLTMAEAAEHPHLVERATFTEVAGRRQPAPAPRLSRTPGSITRPPAAPGEHTREVLAGLGLAPRSIDGLLDRGIAVQAATPGG